MMDTIYISSSMMPRQGTHGFFSLEQNNHQLSLSVYPSIPMVLKLVSVLFALTKVVTSGNLTLFNTLPTAGYVMKHTGTDSPHQNVKVSCLCSFWCNG
jgi:hypothetical protein